MLMPEVDYFRNMFPTPQFAYLDFKLISKLWLYGIKSRSLCALYFFILCLNKLLTFSIFFRPSPMKIRQGALPGFSYVVYGGQKVWRCLDPRTFRCAVGRALAG